MSAEPKRFLIIARDRGGSLHPHRVAAEGAIQGLTYLHGRAARIQKALYASLAKSDELWKGIGDTRRRFSDVVLHLEEPVSVT